MKTIKQKPSQNQAQPPSQPGVQFRTCDLYRETLEAKTRAYPGISQKLADFRQAKFANKLAQYGSRDKPFKPPFTGLMHAHLTHDVSIVYRIHSSNPTLVDLYGLFSHDELGVGQPANTKRQNNMATRMGNQVFSEGGRPIPSFTA